MRGPKGAMGEEVWEREGGGWVEVPNLVISSAWTKRGQEKTKGVDQRGGSGRKE